MYFISYYVISAEKFQRLLKQAEHRKKFAFTPGTKSNRMAQIKMFKNFCTEFGQDSLNPSEETITAYIEFLAQRLKSARSIFNYISGVRSFLKYNRQPTKCLDSYHVDLLLRACKLTLNQPSRKKESVNFKEFRSICKACDALGAKGVLLKVSVTMCFYGMLRQSNICPRSSKSYQYNKNTSRDCISLQDPGLVISLPWTKTRQEGGLPLQVPLPGLLDPVVCPVRAYNKLLKLQPTKCPKQPLLAAKDGKSISCRLLARWFNQAVELAGLSNKSLSLHSLRRSAASIMAHSGVNLAQIKTHADWQSDAFWQYISAQKPADSAVARAMQSLQC